MKPKENITSGSIKQGRRSIRAGLLSAAMVIATAVPAMAVVESVECSWIGTNCRGSWDHGTTATTVWSNYKQLDLTHASSVFGNTASGVHQTRASACMAKGTWSTASLSNVTSGREAFYRNC